MDPCTGALTGPGKRLGITYLGTKTKTKIAGTVSTVSCLGTIGEGMRVVLVNFILKGREPGKKESGSA